MRTFAPIGCGFHHGRSSVGCFGQTVLRVFLCPDLRSQNYLAGHGVRCIGQHSQYN